MDDIRRYQRQWYWKNRDTQLAASKKYHAENREEIIERKKRKYQENKEENIRKAQERRANFTPEQKAEENRQARDRYHAQKMTTADLARIYIDSVETMEDEEE